MKILQHLPAILCSLLSIAVLSALKFNRQSVNFFLMGFFRDIGRIKAHRRRFKGSGKALILADMEILFKLDDPLKDIPAMEDDVPTYTEQELKEYGNGDIGVLLISIFGRVYDVSAGQRYYGDGGRYHIFPGWDVTYALSTGCLSEECLGQSIEGLKDKELGEGKRWLSFFQLHDKYAYVGKLEGKGIDIFVDGIVEKSILEEGIKDEDDMLKSQEDRNQEGNAANQEGSTANQEGSAANQEGSAANQEGSSANQEGGAANQQGGAVNQGGGAVNQGGGAVNQEAYAAGCDFWP